MLSKHVCLIFAEVGTNSILPKAQRKMCYLIFYLQKGIATSRTNLLISLKRNATPQLRKGFSYQVKMQHDFRIQIHKTLCKFRIFAILDVKEQVIYWRRLEFENITIERKQNLGQSIKLRYYQKKIENAAQLIRDKF